MKKTISVILFLIMLFTTAIPSYAESSVRNSDDSSIKFFSDGSYITTTIQIESETSTRATSTKTGSKIDRFYDSDGVLQWTITLKGTFTYNGSTSTCTNSEVSYSVSDSKWKVKEAVASKSGSSAIGDFVVKRYTFLIPVQTESVHMTLTCSANGTLS